MCDLSIKHNIGTSRSVHQALSQRVLIFYHLCKFYSTGMLFMHVYTHPSYTRTYIHFWSRHRPRVAAISLLRVHVVHDGEVLVHGQQVPQRPGGHQLLCAAAGEQVAERPVGVVRVDQHRGPRHQLLPLPVERLPTDVAARHEEEGGERVKWGESV